MQAAPPGKKLLLVDDHQILSDGLKVILEKQPDFVVCGQVFEAEGVLPAIQALQPDLIVLDINLRGTNGIDIGRTILTHFPTVKVLIFTMYAQPKLLDETRRAGLHGYFLKDSNPTDIVKGIRVVLNGGKAFDKRVQSAEPPADLFGDDFAQRLNLTFREVEIIRLIRDGLTNEQVAIRLHISPLTIKTHRKNVYTKLNLTNVADLVQFANRHGL
jgi:DNA-binding NarL/FixJ family response regulator